MIALEDSYRPVRLVLGEERRGCLLDQLLVATLE